jgi:ABC-type antimicrobial peptide transport system permease subunit
MIISVDERRRELGIFRAIGGLRLQVIKMVLLEAIAISLIGLQPARSLVFLVLISW